ncbi:MAG: hypothetical protein JW913_04080 [Chitinispirillaceae bacterium]|nr:hypothetical protein [Chitinispirillaceae bacterium]
MTGQRNMSLLQAAAVTRKNMGTSCLSDDDLLLFAYDEISRTTTYEEQSYRADRPCSD